MTDLIEAITKGDINAKDEFGRTNLHSACMNGDMEIAKLFIDKGIDINAKDKEGKTALNLARRNGHTDIINLLKNTPKTR